jgi:DNA processing protein
VAEGRSHAICLTDAQRLAWLRLYRTENVGPITFRALLNQFGGAVAALEALPELAARGGARRIRLYPKHEAEAEMAALARRGGRFLAMGEPDFPPALAAADGAPPLIAVVGPLDIAARRIVAIVGARNASAAGRSFAQRLARDLGEAGFVVASGLARGIDGAAHQASLATGTAAALAGGLDRIYPPEHETLAAQIADAGLLISEMPLGWVARGKDFPRRNRIIAGLAEGVVVVEAALRSGSLITARLAGEAGREVLVAPGSPLDPRCEGSNRLIRDGATLITSAAHVIEALPGPFAPPAAAPLAEPTASGPPALPQPDQRARIVELLGPTPTAVDTLVQMSGAPARAVQLVLLELELAGRIERHSGGRISLRD